MNGIGANSPLNARSLAQYGLSRAQDNANTHAATIATNDGSSKTDALLGLSQAQIEGQAASKVLEVTDNMLGSIIDRYA